MCYRNRASIHLLPDLRPLAACLAAALGILDAAVAGPVHPEGSIVVTNCADSGAGSLRAAVQDDSAGDPIDLSQLLCSQITLTSGAIHMTRAVTLRGPGSSLLTIDGNDTDRVFAEDAAGATLAIYGMTLQNGYGAFVSGGCVYSAGPVVLDDAVVTGCRVVGHGVGGGVDYYAGGGVSAKGDFTATDSRFVGNEVYASPAGAYGGGVFATGFALLVNATISGNTVENVGWLSSGGGAFFRGTLQMDYSTVSGNVQEGQGYPGGLTVLVNATINHSTISGNTGYAVGGIAANSSGIYSSTISGNTGSVTGGVSASAYIVNSTIAFNDGHCGIYSLSSPGIESSIVALNGYDGLSPNNVCLGFFGTGVLGANNLIGHSTGVPLPPDTIQSDPMLGPLQDNGGATFTHALLPGSPAIDTGNNLANTAWDQRGQDFPRVIGVAADIGAFESPPADQPPVAADDSYATAENAVLTIDAPGVLGNDSDPDGDPLAAVLVDSPSNGLLTLNPDGSFVYVPGRDFFGTDSFTYEADDGQLSSNMATVTVTVSQADNDLIFSNGFD